VHVTCHLKIFYTLDKLCYSFEIPLLGNKLHGKDLYLLTDGCWMVDRWLIVLTFADQGPD
jgi:hypothetical protein